MKKIYFIFPLLTLLLTSCTESSETKPTKQQQLTITEIPLATTASGMPNIYISKKGTAYLSWLEFVNDSLDVMQFSQFNNGQWTSPKEIARGTNWFANWADFPSLVVSEKNESHLTAHFLQYSAEGTYDYDVKITQSFDGGNSWSTPSTAHTDNVNAEHGFVTMLPSEEKTFATWLDGRFTKMVKETTDAEDDHGHGGGPMTLRGAYFDKNGMASDEVELDLRVCDCCQTDAVMGSQGPIVVYRDRSMKEIRDIYIVRKLNSGWSLPKPVHQDNWKIAGCPVNGPSVAIHKKTLAVSWFTMAEDSAKVMIAISNDEGATFEQVQRIDNGNPLGRIHLIFDEKKNKFIVTWLERKGEIATIMSRNIDRNHKLNEPIELINTSAQRASGFPMLEKIKDGYLLAHTEVQDSTSIVKTYFIQNFN